MSNKPATTPKTNGWQRRTLKDSQLAKNRSVQIWDSQKNGPYVRLKHGPIGTRA